MRSVWPVTVTAVGLTEPARMPAAMAVSFSRPPGSKSARPDRPNTNKPSAASVTRWPAVAVAGAGAAATSAGGLAICSQAWSAQCVLVTTSFSSKRVLNWQVTYLSPWPV